jgi:hypothetical protein
MHQTYPTKCAYVEPKSVRLKAPAVVPTSSPTWQYDADDTPGFN